MVLLKASASLLAAG